MIQVLNAFLTATDSTLVAHNFSYLTVPYT